MNHSQIVSFIWSIADLIRDTFKRGKYQDVILPFTVLRRLDCVLAPTKSNVLETNARLKAKDLEKPEALLGRAAGFSFYNTSLYDSGEQTAKIDMLVESKKSLVFVLGEIRARVVAGAVTNGLRSGRRMQPSGIDWMGAAAVTGQIDLSKEL
jgi:type I restriction-modification system DNA methylase subunit